MLRFEQDDWPECILSNTGDPGMGQSRQVYSNALSGGFRRTRFRRLLLPVLPPPFCLVLDPSTRKRISLGCVIGIDPSVDSGWRPGITWHP